MLGGLRLHTGSFHFQLISPDFLFKNKLLFLIVKVSDLQNFVFFFLGMKDQIKESQENGEEGKLVFYCEESSQP